MLACHPGFSIDIFPYTILCCFSHLSSTRKVAKTSYLTFCLFKSALSTDLSSWQVFALGFVGPECHAARTSFSLP